MNRAQLFHAIRASCAIAGIDSVIIIGSQAILGSFDEDVLPPEATMSREVDVLPDVADPALASELADRIEGVGGELSPFEELHGFALDGVDYTTAILPEGWRDRLVPVRSLSTVDPMTGVQYTGWCLSPEDLCVAKLCAGREKDRRFVHSLFAAGLVDRHRVTELLRFVPELHRPSAEAVERELRGG